MVKKILIVDDDVNMRNSIKRLLTADSNYLILEAEDGNVGLEMAVKNKPDLVILDVRMPNKDGYEVCLELMQKKEFEGIKIIGITGYAGKIGDSIMRALGADHFFEKPFDTDKFKAKVKELLGK